MEMPTIGLTKQSSSAAPAVAMPNLVPLRVAKNEAHAIGEVFDHPEDFPIEVRPAYPWRAWIARLRGSTRNQVALRFFSGSRLARGRYVRVTIPLRHKNNEFDARVVAVTPLRVGFETVVEFPSDDDAERLRVVERICTLECELRRSLRTH